MSLRLRLFLLFGALVALLMGAQGWMIRSLSEDLSSEARGMAFSVGKAVISVIQEEDFLPHIVAFKATAAEGEQEIDVQILQGRSLHQQIEVDATSNNPKGRRVIRVVQRGIDGEAEAMGAGAETRLHEILLLLDAQAEEDSLLLKGPGQVRRIPIPRESFDERVANFANRLLFGTLLLLALGLALAALLAHRFTQPLQRLASAAQQVGQGEFGVQVPVYAGGEVGATLTAFNHMSRHLERLEEDSRRLRTGQHLSELGEISRGIAHSLRNPLNALGLTVDTLAEGNLDCQGRSRLAEGARQQIRRMDRSLRSFLALASGGGNPERVDVGALLQDVVLEALQTGVAEGDGDEARVRIEALPAPGLEPLTAVAAELRAVLQTLVINAVEASPAGGRVTVEAHRDDDGRLRIVVEDQGPGLAPEIRERLFTPHLSSKAHGSGMGLFLAHRIAVNRYDGSLALDDRQPEGTRATLLLGHRRNAGKEQGTHG